MNKLQDIINSTSMDLSGMPLHVKKAIHAISTCKTEHSGLQYRTCDHCNYQSHSFLPCGNRYCNNCGSDKSNTWLNKRLRELIPVSYCMVTFTIPSRLNCIFQLNQKVFTSIFFKCAFNALKDTIKYQYSGVDHIAAIVFLQTWSQILNLHVHLHMLVPCGGMTCDYSEWIDFNNKYLVNESALKTLFLQKMVQALCEAKKSNQLILPESISEFHSDDAFKKWLYGNDQKWNIQIEPGEGSPESAFHYLSRYINKTAISDERILSYDKNSITFSYQTDRETKTKAEEKIPIQNFLQRFLQHILKPGVTRIRYFGFLSCSTKNKALKAICDIFNRYSPPISTSKLLEMINESLAKIDKWTDWKCPKCQKGKLIQSFSFRPRFIDAVNQRSSIAME